jgi:broad specificity phosphatase PhoE
MAVTRIVSLVRHGAYQPPAGVGPFFIGRTDPDLNDVGRDQAAALRRFYPNCNNSAVIVSPLKRALSTARIGFPATSVTVNALAIEIDFGALEGLGFADAAAQFPETIRSYPQQDFSMAGGENRMKLIARAKRLLQQVNKAPFLDYKKVIVVSHGFFLDAFSAVIEGTPDRSYKLSFDHCSPYEMKLD